MIWDSQIWNGQNKSSEASLLSRRSPSFLKPRQTNGLAVHAEFMYNTKPVA
jgi:hypothetical protein